MKLGRLDQKDDSNGDCTRTVGRSGRLACARGRRSSSHLVGIPATRRTGSRGWRRGFCKHAWTGTTGGYSTRAEISHAKPSGFRSGESNVPHLNARGARGGPPVGGARWEMSSRTSEARAAAEVWMRQATYDIETSRLLRDKELFVWACFTAQQTAEKAIKAACIANGKPAREIHDLDQLLLKAPTKVRKAFKNVGELDVVSLQVFVSRARYPVPTQRGLVAPVDSITKEDAERAIKTAQKVLARCRKLC
jgi:HEPN domain-containing protein